MGTSTTAVWTFYKMCLREIKERGLGWGGGFGLMLCSVTETVRLNLMNMKRHGVLLESSTQQRRIRSLGVHGIGARNSRHAPKEGTHMS